MFIRECLFNKLTLLLNNALFANLYTVLNTLQAATSKEHKLISNGNVILYMSLSHKCLWPMWSLTQLIWATLHKYESAWAHVSALLQTSVIMGAPQKLKTDHGSLLFTSSEFWQFCIGWQIKHIAGKPYDPQDKACWTSPADLKNPIITKKSVTQSPECTCS